MRHGHPTKRDCPADIPRAFIAIGFDKAKELVLILAFATSYDQCQAEAKAAVEEPSGEYACDGYESFEINGKDAGQVRLWFRRTFDLPWTKVQQVCDTVVKACREMFDRRQQGETDPVRIEEVPGYDAKSADANP